MFVLVGFSYATEKFSHHTHPNMKKNSEPEQFESDLRAAQEHLQARRAKKAERAYHDILRQSPAHPAANFGLGMLQHAAGMDQTAINHLRTVVDAWPQHLEARFALAVSLYRLRRLEESARQFDKLVRYHPRIAEAHNYLGIVKAQLGLSREAEKHFLRALNLQPSLAEAHKNLGTHLSEQGRIGEARKHLIKAIHSRPNYAQAYWQLASITQFTEYDADIKAMESSYDRNDATEDEKMRLAYALGKAFHDLQQYPRAFEYWREGNRLRRQLTGYNVAPILAEMKAMKRVFRKVASMRTDRFDRVKPTLLFIVGMPRSGTSLCEQILASHSSVYGAGELDALDRIIRRAVQRFPADLVKLKPADWKSIRERYLSEIKTLAGTAACVSDKMPGNFLHIGAINQLFPDARIIHCQRNTMDTGLSCFRNHFVSDQLGFTCDLTDLGRYIQRYLELMEYWNQSKMENIYKIHYETLVTEPEREVRNLLKFCKLPFETSCLTFHENRRTVKTASAVQVRKPIYRDSVDAWKRYERELQPLRFALEKRSGRFTSILSSMTVRVRRSS